MGKLPKIWWENSPKIGWQNYSSNPGPYKRVRTSHVFIHHTLIEETRRLRCGARIKVPVKEAGLISVGALEKNDGLCFKENNE